MYKYDIPKLSEVTFTSDLLYNSYYPGLSEWTVLFLQSLKKGVQSKISQIDSFTFL